MSGFGAAQGLRGWPVQCCGGLASRGRRDRCTVASEAGSCLAPSQWRVLCDRLSTAARDLIVPARTIVPSQYVSELGTEEENLRRVVDPDYDHDQRPGRAVRRADTSLAQVETDERLSQTKESGGYQAADP